MYFIFQVSKPNWIRLSYPSDSQRYAGSMAVGTGGDAGAEIAPPDFGRKRSGVCKVGGTGGAGDETVPPDFGRKRNADSRADGTGGAGTKIAPSFGRKRSKSCSIRISNIAACPLKLVFYELSYF